PGGEIVMVSCGRRWGRDFHFLTLVLVLLGISCSKAGVPAGGGPGAREPVSGGGVVLPPPGVECFAISADGKTVIAALDGTVKLWDAQTGTEIRAFNAHPERVNCLSLSAIGQRLATGSADKTLKLWDLAGGQELHTLQGHTVGVSAVAFAPDGKT